MADPNETLKLFEELDDSIKKEAHEDTLALSQKILKKLPTDQDALQCKIVSLINLGKSNDLEKFISSENKKETFVLEYAYSLYGAGKYQQSIQHLEMNKKNNPQLENEIDTLLAQNYNKLGDYNKSYDIYKHILLSKKEDLENEGDLLTNFLAVYALSNANDFELLKSIQKYINSWECFYNYALIFLNQKNYNECLQTMKRCKEDFNENMDDFNKTKEKFMNFFILQNLFDGFDIHKVSNLNIEYEKIIKDEKFKKNDNYPYFYNNYLYLRKDFDSCHEVVKKIDSFLTNDKFSPLEKKILLKNKINFLIRGNKIQEASDLLNKTLEDSSNQNDIDFLLMKCFIYYKNEKEKFDSFIQQDSLLKSKISSHAFILQIMLSNLNLKTYEQFHKKILSFVNDYKEFCMNYKFISFFIGFYTSKKLLTYLKEFLDKFNNPSELYEHNHSQGVFKDLTMKIGENFFKLGDYKSTAKFCEFFLDKVNPNDKTIKILFIQCLSHEDITKCEDFRRSFDDNSIDLSYEHMNNLLNEFFTKFKRTTDKQKKTEKKKKKKKIRYPKNFNPKEPGPEPDPERWIPRLQRKKYRNTQKNKMAYQGASADNKTTTAQKFK